MQLFITVIGFIVLGIGGVVVYLSKHIVRHVVKDENAHIVNEDEAVSPFDKMNLNVKLIGFAVAIAGMAILLLFGGRV